MLHNVHLISDITLRGALHMQAEQQYKEYRVQPDRDPKEVFSRPMALLGAARLKPLTVESSGAGDFWRSRQFACRP